jgi:hypothetical protein
VAVQDRDVYYLFGSTCRLMSGKISAKEWRTTVQDIWLCSLQTVRDLNGTSEDVPTYAPPVVVVPVPPINGTPTPDPSPCGRYHCLCQR